MRKNIKTVGKKGVFMTFSIILIAGLLVTSAFIILNNRKIDSYKHLSQTTSEIKIFDITDSLSNSIKRILEVTTEIEININENNVSITEKIPLNINDFTEEFANLKNYTELYNPEIQLNQESAEEFDFRIMPQNISYEHDFVENKIIISFDELSNISEIETAYIKIVSPENITFNSWNYEEGETLLRIEVEGDATYYYDENLINFLDDSRTSFELGDITIIINNSIMEIKNHAGAEINVTTDIEFEEKPGFVEISNIIQVNLLEEEIFSNTGAVIS